MTRARRPGPRTRFAAAAGRAAGRASRLAGRQGGIIGGRVALLADPDALARLAAGRMIVLVSGTNGKSTTTVLLAAAMRVAGGPVATNIGGANMPDGLVAALIAQPEATRAVLEVDEPYLPRVLDATRPSVVVLLNLSRDQLDRTGETRLLADRLRLALTGQPQAVVVAEADDPLVVWAVRGARRRVWVSTRGGWIGDTALCPACGAALDRTVEQWACPCGLRRPDPDWALDGDQLRAADNSVVRLRLALPGRMNLGNAAHAMAAADASGVAWRGTLPQIAAVREVHGRYRTVLIGDRRVRLLLAKNPAGWQALLELLEADRSGVVLALNARQADGRDPSWLWDVDLERLRGRSLVAAGERAADVAVRLTYAGLAHVVEPDILDAVRALPAGPVDLIGDYTAFLAAMQVVANGTDVC